MPGAGLVHVTSRAEASCGWIIDFGTRQRPIFLVPPSGDQHSSVRKTRRRMAIAGGRHRRGGKEFVCGRIKKLRGPIGAPASYQDAAVLKECCGVTGAIAQHPGAVCEFSTARIVKLGRINRVAARVWTPARDQDSAVAQQRSAVVDSVGFHRTGRSELASGRIEKFGLTLASSRYKYAPVEQRRRALAIPARHQVSGGTEAVARHVEQFGRRRAAPNDEDPAIIEQGDRRIVARRGHRTGRLETARGRIEDLG